jgi:hypothetical protein
MSQTIPPHTFVPSTPPLKQRVDAVDLGKRTPFQTSGKGATFDQFSDATGLDDVQLEIIKMVCIRTIFMFIY